MNAEPLPGSLSTLNESSSFSFSVLLRIMQENSNLKWTYYKGGLQRQQTKKKSEPKNVKLMSGFS